MVQRILMLALRLLAFSSCPQRQSHYKITDIATVQIGSCSGDESYDGARWFIYLFEHLFY